jgi:tetratricopeptide (TPR) repeat protein
MKEDHKTKKGFIKLQHLFNFLDEDIEDLHTSSTQDIEQELKQAQIDVTDFKRRLSANIKALKKPSSQVEPSQWEEPIPAWMRTWSSLGDFLLNPSWKMSVASLLGFMLLTIFIIVNKPVPDDIPVYRGQKPGQQTDTGEDTRMQDDVTRLNQEINIYFDLGEYSKAVPLAQKVLELQELRRGANHIDVATAMNNLAVLYKRLGQIDEAERLYLKTLSIQKQWLGETHHQTLASMQHLAQLYEQQGETREAIVYYQNILNVRTETLGEDHEDVRALQGKIQALKDRPSNNIKESR